MVFPLNPYKDAGLIVFSPRNNLAMRFISC
jgi:hypothetical protein